MRSHKELTLTQPEHVGALQLNSGVRWPPMDR